MSIQIPSSVYAIKSASRHVPGFRLMFVMRIIGSRFQLSVRIVPEERASQGLILEMLVERNIALPSLRRLLLEDEGAIAQPLMARFGIRGGCAAGTLSGGNQQKVVLAKWLARKPRLLIVDEPTRGIDVGTKAEVHRLLSELAAQGVAVLMISSELPEVLGMADRVVVLFEGRLTRTFERAEATEDAIMHAATGQIEAAA